MTRLTMYNPTRDIFRMQRELDRVFDNFFTPETQHSSDAPWQPDVDFYETSDAFVLEMDLPGLTKEDVNVEYEDGVLRIQGERALVHGEQNTYHRTERRHGRFSRALRLGQDIEADGITASFDNGVLTVRAPKVEQKKPVQVQIA